MPARCQEEDAVPPTCLGVKAPSNGKQGKRTDIDAAWAMVEAGASEYEIAKAHPHTYARYNNGIRRYQQLHKHKTQDNSTRDIKVYVLWGEPGTGKSRWCRDYAKSQGWSLFENIDENNSGKISFESYDGEVSLSLQATALILF